MDFINMIFKPISLSISLETSRLAASIQDYLFGGLRLAWFQDVKKGFWLPYGLLVWGWALESGLWEGFGLDLRLVLSLS